ncbi:hypothetical protein C4544_04140 [candidate division WS5 bacterium]|uniref:Uncharacterized protein n=1 Tax=candidate division WS5 bacterium TaxID=2093353 RepID=A0A419DCQ7_9BACT|nr:MAG: hypothetical protein C4544_04140 [candidate division WS5 bacterium]
MPKSTKTITDEVLKSLKILDDLSQNTAKKDPVKKGAITISKETKELKKALNALKDDIEFFKQAKEMGTEAYQKIKAGEINNKEKEAIINFINNCYEDGGSIKDNYLEITKDKLLEILETFSKDVDEYILTLNQKLKDIDGRIVSEIDAHNEIRKDLLKEELEEEDKALEDINVNSNKFDQELERLELLEDELSLAVIEQENQDQIENVRNLIKQR